MRGIAICLALVLSLSETADADSSPRVYSCEPALPVFCRNVHVACAGATRIRTSPFTVDIVGAAAQVIFEGANFPAQGNVSRSRDLVIRLDGGRNWIRIEPDNRYSHRIYRARGAAMTHGACVRQ